MFPLASTNKYIYIYIYICFVISKLCTMYEGCHYKTYVYFSGLLNFLALQHDTFRFIHSLQILFQKKKKLLLANSR